MTDTLIAPDPVLDDTEVGTIAHLIRQEDLGATHPVVALCGHVFIPGPVPAGAHICKPCQDALARVQAGKPRYN